MRTVTAMNHDVRRAFAPIALMLALTLLAGSLAPAAARADEPQFVRLETGAGDILLVFYPELAPHHVGNFTHLARTGFYDGSKFHRIVPGFVIQGGDPNSKDADPRNDGMGGPTMTDVLDDEENWTWSSRSTIKLESKGYARAWTVRPTSRPNSVRRPSMAWHPEHGPQPGCRFRRQPVLHLRGRHAPAGRPVHDLRPRGHGHGGRRRHRQRREEPRRRPGCPRNPVPRSRRSTSSRAPAV